MSFLKDAKKGVLWTFLQQFSVQGINFIVQIILARLLLPSDFGLVAMIAVFIALGQNLSDSGMSTSLIRNKNNNEIDYSTVFITNLFISLTIYAVVYFIAPFVAAFYEQPILSSLLRLYCIVFVISAFSAVQLAKFTKELNFKVQFSFQLPSTIIGAITGVFLAYLGYGVWSLIWLNIVQNLVFALVLWCFHNWRPRWKFDKDVFRTHFDFGYKLTLSSLLNTIYLNLYKMIIGKQFSTSSVGFFTQADNMRLFPIMQLSVVLNKVTFPLFAKISDDSAKLRLAYISAMRLVLSISAAMMLVLLLIAEPLFLTIFGEKWLPSVPYFRILCVASIFLPIGTYNLNILKVKGRSDLFLRVEVIKKVIGTCALFFAIPFGIVGMVWALCLTNIFFAYLNGYFSGRFIDYSISKQLKDSLFIITLAVVPAICCYIVKRAYLSMSELNVIADGVITFFLYFIFYIPVVWFLNPELLIDIRRIIKR